MALSNFLTGHEAIASVAAAEITLHQVLQDHKDRYEQKNDQVKAWACVDMTKIPPSIGPLTGVVIGIKDIMRLSYAITSLYRQLTRRHSRFSN